MVVEQEQHLHLASRERLGDPIGDAAAEPAAGANLLEQPAGNLA
jgi:hypothetical protein